jgi:hypothetical protein
MKKNTSHSVKTLRKTSLIGKYEVLFSFIFASVLVLGHILFTNVDIDVSDIADRTYLAYIFSFITTWGIALFFLTLVKHLSTHTQNISGPVFLEKLSDKKLWLLTSLGIFICYLPLVFLTISVLTPDSWNSLGQITGTAALSNAHPLIFTVFVSIFIHIGLLFGSLELGTLLFSLAQSAILALIFARIIVWMRQEKIGTYGITAALIYYAILPINAIAGTIMWKDILFAGFGLLFMLVLRKLYIEKELFFTRKNVAYFILLAFLFCTLRNNGLYAYVLFFVLVIVFDYKKIKNIKLLILLLSPILLATVYQSLISLVAKPASTSVASLSVPAQQVARTVKYHKGELTDKEKVTLNEISSVDRIGEKYNPNLSDPVMGTFDTKVFEKNKPKYFGLWLELFKEHPKTFIAATLYNTYAYVYPYYVSPTPTDTIMDNSIHPNAFKGHPDSAYLNGNKQAVITYESIISDVAPIIHNIGFYSCMILLGAYVAISRKKRELAGVFILLFSLFVTTILGPVNGEFRYLYLFVVAVPFIMVSVLSSNTTKVTRLKK